MVIPSKETWGKISAMILKVTEGFFDMGETLEKKYATACSAWNIACFESPKRGSV